MLGYGLVLLGLLSVITADSDPCLAGNHVTLNDPTRYTTYVTDLSSVRCDNGTIKQWYRIPFGSVATTPPPVNRCGTTQPVWIEPSTLPSTGDTQLVTLCLRRTYATCPVTGVILAKNCGSFYVYELRPLNADYCPLAYCLEWDSSQKVIPSVSSSLVAGTIQFDGVDFQNKEILFTCDLQANTGVNLETLYYDVVWYINDQEIKRTTDLSYSAFLTDGVLREGEWRGQHSLGIQVKCAVEAKAGVSTGTGILEHSSPFYAGLKAELSGDFLQENGELNLTITLTVPLGCTYTNDLTADKVAQHEQKYCNMRVRVVTPKEEYQCTRGGVTKHAAMFKNKQCGVLIYHSSWETPAVMKIHGAPDNIVNSGHRAALFQLRTDDVHTHGVWSQVVGEEIQINIHDDDMNITGRKCYSSNDPHLRTFDGRSYEFHQTGEYVLYKHDTLPVAIHAYFQPCDWGLPNAKCNCGIGIRYDNNVFRANFCKYSSTGFNRIVEYNGCDKDAMKIRQYQSSNRYGSAFQITLPTGTSVTFAYGFFRTAIFIHYIYVKPSVMDWKSTSGLCGYMDGSTANDFKKKDGIETSDASEFGTSWKITDGGSESLFINPLPTQPPTMTSLEYCACKNDTTFDEHASCSASPAEPCSPSDTSVIGSFGYLDTCRTTYQKRSADDEEVFFPLYPNLGESDDTESGVPDWSSGWTETSAAAACREFFHDSPLVQKCEEVIQGFDSEDYVPDCTKDIQFSGSTSFMESTLELMKTACITEAVRLENLTNDDTGSGTTILDEMLALRCSNNCSHVGTCINGTCQCETGYLGDDCSISGNAPPSLSQETNVGLCDTSINLCSKYLISGQNFVPTQLTCKAQAFKVDDSSIQIEGEAITFPATYVNTFLCICSIPASRKRRSTSASLPSGYKISISNDGTTFSAEVTFINFDTNCFECSITPMTCTKKTGSCHTVNADSRPSLSDDSPDKRIGIGVGVAAAVFFVVVIAVVFICILKHKSGKSAAVGSLPNLKIDDKEVPPSQSTFQPLDAFPFDRSDKMIISAFPLSQVYSKEKTDLAITDCE